MRLVRIALSRREIGPTNAWFHSQPIQDTPETQQSAVGFRFQANGLTKDCREVAMTVATFPHHIPHSAGRTKTREGVGNQGIDSAHTRPSRRESSLEHIKAIGRRRCLAELLPNLGSGSGSPHILQRRMDMRERAGRRADHQLGCARTKQRSDARPGY